LDDSEDRSNTAIVGGQGGGGVLLIRRNDTWSNPAFYTRGGASIGAQLGGRSGSTALLLMNDKAVHVFENHPSTWTQYHHGGPGHPHGPQSHPYQSHGLWYIWAVSCCSSARLLSNTSRL
jgi:hypothetical protein